MRGTAGRKDFRETGTLDEISRGAFFDLGVDLGGGLCALSNLEEGLGVLKVGFEDLGGEDEVFVSER